MKSEVLSTADDASTPLPRRRVDAARLFHSAAFALLLALAFAGFHRFYLHGRAFPDRELTPPIRMSIIVHGVIMSAWMLLALVQPLLIAARRHRLHMRLGWLGAALAAGVTVTGLHLAIVSARATPAEARIWGLAPRPFMAVPFWIAVTFGLMVAAAVWQRRRPAPHRALMLMATVAAMSAAISRIQMLNDLYAGTIWESLFGPFFTTALVGGGLVLAQGVMARGVDRWLAAAFTALTVIFLVIWRIAPTAGWAWLAGLMV